MVLKANCVKSPVVMIDKFVHLAGSETKGFGKLSHLVLRHIVLYDMPWVITVQKPIDNLISELHIRCLLTPPP